MIVRRDFLASVAAAVAVAGCSTQQETDPTGPSNDTTESETDSSNETEREQTEPETDLELSVDSAEWFEEGFVAEFIVTNRGDRPIRQLEIVVDWYDGEEKFIGWDSVRAPALGTDKSWFTYVESSINEPADSFEMIARGFPRTRDVPDGLEIQSSEVVEAIPEVTGIITNARSSEIGANVIATVYDSDWLTHVGSTTQSRIPSGADWRFHAPIDPVDADVSPPGEEVELFVNRL